MNTFLKVNHTEACHSQLNSNEKELFGGLDDVCKGYGRIYKRVDKDGHSTYFRAEGFFSRIYHYFFSNRLDWNDLYCLNLRISNWFYKCPDASSKFRVEAVFDKVLRQVQKNDYADCKNAESLVFNHHSHSKIVTDIGKKLHDQLYTVPLPGQNFALTQGEVAVLREILKFSYIPYSLHSAAIEKVKKGSHPICKAFESLQELDQNADANKGDVSELKLRAKSGLLSEEEIEAIILAKAKLAELKTRLAGNLDIESFRSVCPGLDRLMELSDIKDVAVQGLNNRKIAEKLVKENGSFYSFISEDLKGDFGIASMALTRNPNDLEIVKEVVRRFGELLILASEQAKDNPDIVALAVKNNPRAFEMASRRIQTTHLEIAKLAIENRSARPELVKYILKQNGKAMMYAPEQYQKDPSFLSIIIGEYPHLVLPYLSPEKRKEVIEEKLNSFAAGGRVDQSAIAFLEVIVEEVLKDPVLIKDDKLKTTFWVVCEEVAHSYLPANVKKAIEWRVKVAQAITPGAPLNDLQAQLQHEDPRLGIRLTSVDTSLFKNQTMAVQRQRFTTGLTRMHLEAKLSHHARAKLKDTLNYISFNPMAFFNALPPGFCNQVTTEKQKVGYKGRVNDVHGKKFAGHFSNDIGANGYTINATQQIINFAGVGKVKIGNDSDYHAEYNRLEIELDSSITEAEAVNKLNVIFAALGLGPVNSSSRESDIERIKIMQLFRAFYPQQAFNFERDKQSYQQTIEELKDAISMAVPDMKQKFKHYLEEHPELMYQQEIYPGQSIWAVRGLAQEVRNRGGMGLMAGVTADTFQDATYRFASILKMGALSTQDRFKLGVIAAGASSSEDLRSGGAESVFARLLTNHMPKKPGSYSLPGKMQILYDLDLVERVGYAYSGDKYGKKDVGDYDKRQSILELTSKYSSEAWNANLGNEVCIRNRVSPQFIKGVMVSDLNEKHQLLATLMAEGLITKDDLNNDCINGIPVDQFIHIGEFKAEYWA